MQDLRDALRAMAGQPLVTGIAVLSLALGIGANAAIFSILDSLLLKTLPIRNPESLIALASERPGVDAAMGTPSGGQSGTVACSAIPSYGRPITSRQRTVARA